jgi:uncharacterized membrane protein (UPF0127 family)
MIEYLMYKKLLLISILFITIAPVANAIQKQKLCSLFFNNGINLHNIQLASNTFEQAKGLSGSTSTEVGMLFLFSKPSRPVFWMRDTLLPLSIGFFSVDSHLFQIEDMVPKTDIHHFPEKPIMVALELPQGKFAELGLSIGTLLSRYECK